MDDEKRQMRRALRLAMRPTGLRRSRLGHYRVYAGIMRRAVDRSGVQSLAGRAVMKRKGGRLAS